MTWKGRLACSHSILIQTRVLPNDPPLRDEKYLFKGIADRKNRMGIPTIVFFFVVRTLGRGLQRRPRTTSSKLPQLKKWVKRDRSVDRELFSAQTSAARVAFTRCIPLRLLASLLAGTTSSEIPGGGRADADDGRQMNESAPLRLC